MWKIFQKHQMILEDIQDLHLHFNDFKNGTEKEFAFLKEATLKNKTASNRHTPHLYAHM